MKRKKPTYETLARAVRRLKAEAIIKQGSFEYIRAIRKSDRIKLNEQQLELQQLQDEVERMKSDKLRLSNLCNHQAKSLMNWFGSWSNKQNECCQLRAENARLQDRLEQFKTRERDNAMRKIWEMEAA